MNNRILYFIKGRVPTNEEMLKAEPLWGKGPFVEFISLETFDLNSPILENVGVYGAVPEAYKKAAEPEEKPKAKAKND